MIMTNENNSSGGFTQNRMPNWSDYDDLGAPDGSVDIDGAGVVKKKIFDWGIAAFGTRPRDHRQRDLLLGSMARDIRAWRFHKLHKNMPVPFFHDTVSYDSSKRKMITTCRCFMYDHWLHIEQRLRQCPPELVSIHEKLGRCWPTLFQVEPSPNLARLSRDVCRKGHLCPFCFSRNVDELYDRIEPLANQANFLILAYVNINDEQLDSLEHLCGPKERLNYVRNKLGGEIIQALKKHAGAEGGIKVVQVGPKQHSGDYWDDDGERACNVSRRFEYRLAVVGAIHDQLEKMEKFISYYEDYGDTPVCETLVALEAGLHIKVGSLRSVLIGSSKKSEESEESICEPGAFVWFPWSVANDEQWFTYMDIIKSSRLFDQWGTWYGRGNERPQACCNEQTQ